MLFFVHAMLEVQIWVRGQKFNVVLCTCIARSTSLGSRSKVECCAMYKHCLKYKSGFEAKSQMLHFAQALLAVQVWVRGQKLKVVLCTCIARITSLGSRSIVECCSIKVNLKVILFNVGGQTGKDCLLTWADGVKVADCRD